jgi:Zn-dependent peptidase ImmA (M78 family)
MFTKEGINNLADVVRNAFNLSCPYNPEIAVKKLDGRIMYDVENMAIDACIRKTGEESFIISLNGKKPFLRDRFTMAHELGHLFLHMGFLVQKELWEKQDKEFQDSPYYRMSRNYIQEESEADEFASAFLMPIEEFKKEIYKKSNKNRLNSEALTNHFKVSLRNVLTRATQLGYIESAYKKDGK